MNVRELSLGVKRFAWPLACGAFLAIGAATASGRAERVNLFPRLRVGQTLSYQVSYHSDKQVRTDSSLIVAEAPGGAEVQAHGLLYFEVLAIEPRRERARIHARTRFITLDSDSHLKTPRVDPSSPQTRQEDGQAKSVEFTILPDGRVDQITGLDALPPEQQDAWREWVSRFVLTAVFPGNAAKVAQKWKSREDEKSPSPIAGLRWLRQSTYVGNEPCHAVRMTVQGDSGGPDGVADTCAVILTTASLKQESSAKNATPEDFKLHDLRTTGTARGTNRIITYVSLTTGLLVRATEEASQQMDVTVAKADGSNRVRYNVNARSRSEIVLVVAPPATHP